FAKRYVELVIVA
nr:RecName: Full=Snake venom metalloproteinase; Short=SVMP; AltName: Full=Proteinase E [Crotalus molossus nigrescens]